MNFILHGAGAPKSAACTNNSSSNRFSHSARLIAINQLSNRSQSNQSSSSLVGVKTEYKSPDIRKAIHTYSLMAPVVIYTG